jgi:hypothetical protein
VTRARNRGEEPYQRTQVVARSTKASTPASRRSTATITRSVPSGSACFRRSSNSAGTLSAAPATAPVQSAVVAADAAGARSMASRVVTSAMRAI